MPYQRITIGGYDYYAHRLAWFYVYGEWPVNELDHIDEDKENNAIDNLREATHAENLSHHYALNPRASYVRRRPRKTNTKR